MNWARVLSLTPELVHGLIALLDALAVAILARLTQLVRRDMNNGITQRKTVFTKERPESPRTASVNHTPGRAPRHFALDELDAEECTHFLRMVAREGDCCCFALTSDRGAISVTVLQGSTRHKAYAATPEELYVCFSTLLAELY